MNSSNTLQSVTFRPQSYLFIFIFLDTPCSMWDLSSLVQLNRSVLSDSFDPMNCSMPDHSVHHQLPEFTQIHIHWVSNAMQLSHPLSPPALNLYQHQGLFQWVSSSNHVAKVWEFQHQHQSFQWIFRTDCI